jgi:putative membrane protein
MIMWYGGGSWGWCSVIVNVLAVVVFLSAIIAAIVVAVRFPTREGSAPSAPRDGGSSRAQDVLATRFAGGGFYDDEFERRLM